MNSIGDWANDFSCHSFAGPRGLIIVFYLVALMVTLHLFDLTPFIAGILVSAGVAGIILGFAAKDVMQNFLAEFL